MPDGGPKVLFLFPSSVERKQVFSEGNFFSKKFYTLAGWDLAPSAGFIRLDDFDRCEKVEASRWGAFVDRAANKALRAAGGYGGFWYKVWKCRDLVDRCDAVLAVNDRVGIPLVLLMAGGLVPKRPVVYLSIGLPFRLDAMKPYFRRLLRGAFGRCVRAVGAYGFGESRTLADFFGSRPRVEFIPFGVDPELFSPGAAPGTSPVLSIGADSNRDYQALFAAARALDRPVTVVARPGRVPEADRPANVAVEFDVPFDKLPAMMRESSFVILPVRQNLYSGATTTLLQAMACGKAVVVSRTRAIEDGYGFRHGENLMFAEPGDSADFAGQCQALAGDPELRARIGSEARRLVERSFTYGRYCADVFSLVRAAAV